MPVLTPGSTPRNDHKMKKIAIFASGSGTNAENLINFFSNEKRARVSIVLTNRSDAFVIERAKRLSVDTMVFDRDDFYNTGRVAMELAVRDIDMIVLAGFLWLVPKQIIDAYPGRIINIHPALLPAYGGKGMYGDRVHRAVIENSERESGITIHYVNEKYDEGSIIFQAKCRVEQDDTPESLAKKIHELEYRHFPEVVARVLETIE